MRLAAVAAACLVLGSLAACNKSPDWQRQSKSLTAGAWQIVSYKSGKCLDVVGSAKRATQETCTGATTQSWTVRMVSGGIQVVSTSDPTKCLNIANASGMPGNPVVLGSCSSTGVPGEIWNPVAVDSSYNLVAIHDNQCMDVDSASLASGTAVNQWLCNGGSNQRWVFNALTPPPTDAGMEAPGSTDAGMEAPGSTDGPRDTGAADAGADGPSSIVQIVAPFSGKCLDVVGPSVAATQQTCGAALSQRWSIRSVSGGIQIVSASSPTRCLNIANASGMPGNPVVLAECSGTGVPGEIWTEAATPDGRFNLVATHDGQCMDVGSQSTADGAPVNQWICNGGSNQKWTFNAVAPPPPDAGMEAPPPADAGAADAGATEAGGGGPPSIVQIVAPFSGKCLDVVGTAIAATEQTCGAALSQRWLIRSVTGGIQIVSAASPTRCLNIANASGMPGNAVVLSECSDTGVPGEIWSEATTPDGTFNLVATHDGQCMDISGQSTADGTPVNQWLCNGGSNQKWTFSPVAPPPPDAGLEAPPPADAGAADAGAADAGGGPPAIVQIVSRNSGKCLDVSGSSWAVQNTCSGAPSQHWLMKPVPGGFQLVSSTDELQCLNVPGASGMPGFGIALAPCSVAGVPGEIWNPQTAPDNSVAFQAVHDGQCMDVDNASTADGAPVNQWLCNGGSNQHWDVQPAISGPPDAGSPPPDSGSGSIDAPTPDAAGPAPDGGSGDAGGSLPVVELVAQHSLKCLDVVSPATNATQQTCIQTNGQLYSLRAVIGGVQLVSAVDGSKCLAVLNGSYTAGAPVVLTQCSAGGTIGDIWDPRPLGNDQYNLVAVHSQQCMDVSGVSSQDGVSINQWNCNGQGNQVWAFPWAPPPPDPAKQGQWSAIIAMPSIPVAAAVLPNGKVLTWASWDRYWFGGTPQPNQTYTALFDPATLTATETLMTVPAHDMFCPGTAMLADGRVFVNGGGPVVASTSIYDSTTATWTADALMNQPRWYNVSVTLPDGRVFTLGGNARSGLDGRGEIWAPGAGWTTVPGAVMTPLLTSDTTNRSEEHPRLFVAPNGKVFVPGPTPNMQWYDLSGTGSIQSAGLRGDDGFSQNNVTVMFDVGKLLEAGGNPNYDRTGADVSPSSTNSYVIDINGGVANVQKTQSMTYGRAYASGVVLPNGEVLVVGGLSNGKAFTDTGAVMIPEVFSPTTQTWRPMAPMAVPRTYHSVALLLTDGRVFVGGGGLCGQGCAANHPDVQIFSPPYLFQGVRPTIDAAPGSAVYGSTVNIGASGKVTGFTWVRMSSITHTINTDQRLLRATFTVRLNGSFDVTTPANANVAPPGNYMLFAMSGSVPSVAKVLRIGP
jgi:galactose oxidase